ncbi:hypothetical protein [Sphingobium sp. ZW T5_29]|uniref:hypothetical protein n=1 Tax=Sphingobium sp. ZW T5_29 TaxID=3378077 RepID=UPI0038549DC6
MANISFETLNYRAAKQLRDAADRVEKAAPPATQSWSIAFSGVSDGRLDSLIDEIAIALPKNTRSLYTFELIDGELAAVRSAFELARGNRCEGRAYARLNGDDAECAALYVGSSRNTVSRLRQHLGFGPVKTYALHIAAWARGLEGNILLSVHRYGDETTDEMLVALEDQLWAEMKPAFGRRGTK